MITLPEECRTWSNPGGWGRQRWSVNSVKDCLDGAGLRDRHQFDFYVQGSFANNTHTGPESDIDVVVALQECWASNIGALPKKDRDQYDEVTERAEYDLAQFKNDVDDVLRPEYFRRWGDKCLKLKEYNDPFLLPIDVLVCVEYRHYKFFHDLSDQDYIPGVCFVIPNAGMVVNFPKLHLLRGNVKDRRVGGNYKPVIRIAKNAYRWAVEQNLLPAGSAAGYFIECLLFNVPDEHFSSNHWLSFRACFERLRYETAALSGFECQHGMGNLFGDGPEQWRKESAVGLVDCMVEMRCRW